eukprot:Opistho-2@51127
MPPETLRPHDSLTQKTLNEANSCYGFASNFARRKASNGWQRVTRVETAAPLCYAPANPSRGCRSFGAPLFRMGPFRDSKRKHASVENSGGIQASLSGRYATALFELAREKGAIDKVESSLGAVKQALADSPAFAALASSPLVGRTEATNAVAAAAKVMKLDSLTADFPCTLR